MAPRTEIPVFQKQQVETGTQFSAGGAGIIREQASASERLQARLSGGVRAAQELMMPIVTEETQKKALEDVKAGNIDSKNVALVAQDVYRRTAESSFLADVEVGAKQLGTNLVNEQTLAGRYDANAINSSWDSYVKGTTSGIKDVAVKTSIETRLAKMGQQFQAQVATLQTNQQRQMQYKNLSAKLEMDTTSLKAAIGVNPEDTLRLQQEIDATLQTMVDSNLIAPNVATSERKKIAKGAYLSNMQRNLTTAINSGDAYKFYSDFKNMDHQGILSNTDIETFRQSIQSQIATDVKVYNNQLSAQETQFKLTELETTNEFNELWMQGELTTTQIDNALATNKIDLATHKTYTDRIQTKGKAVDNSTALLQFQTHVLDFTEDEIINSPHLTDKTKWDLIKQRRSEQEDEANWLSSQGGKEARDRIKRTFNIIDGTLMAQMDFNNKNMQDYDELYRNFYAEVEALPFDQRSSKSISIADKHIKQYKEAKATVTLERKKEREEKKKADEKKSESTYGETTGKFMNMLEDKWNSATRVWEDFE